MAPLSFVSLVPNRVDARDERGHDARATQPCQIEASYK
jgi:hypothetical protein